MGIGFSIPDPYKGGFRPAVVGLLAKLKDNYWSIADSYCYDENFFVDIKFSLNLCVYQ